MKCATLLALLAVLAMSFTLGCSAKVAPTTPPAKVTPTSAAPATGTTGQASTTTRDAKTGKEPAAPAKTTAGAAAAEVKIAVAYNDLEHATPEFKFKEVPSPAKVNAATTAKITIIDGEKDRESADVEVLNDGKLPTNQDEPAANFFFNAGTEGGRLLIDLGRSIKVKQVNTYSWHTNTRAPQVYTLYAADGAAAGFNAKPTDDPTKAGWKQIAKVDTRPKTGDPGGQYGVSLSGTPGALGEFRYLLIATHSTESDDLYGNTFFSEITVIDANEGK